MGAQFEDSRRRVEEHKKDLRIVDEEKEEEEYGGLRFLESLRSRSNFEEGEAIFPVLLQLRV